MDIVTDIPLAGGERRSGVQADAHTDGARRKGLRQRGCSGEGAACSGKREKEGVSLRIDLDAAISTARLPDRRSVVGQCIRVGICAELTKQRRRAFDVGEHEGDSAARKLGTHAVIIRWWAAGGQAG